MNRARADALLLFIAVLWGAAALFLLPWAVWEARRSTARLTRADMRNALWIGLCLCVGCWGQQIGLQTTTATHAGFLTAVYLVFVPFVAWAFSGSPPRPLVLLACAIALYGAWLLCGGATLDRWSRGDLLILGSDLVWALHITLLGHAHGIAARPMLLSFLQCAITGALSLPIALAWQPAGADALVAALPAIAYAGVVSSGFAFTMQIVAQRHTPPAEAALIMALESVFAALAGAWLLRESMSLAAIIGAALILLGAVFVEAGPLLLQALGNARARLFGSALRNRP
jgi:drug/metabolite transporter (DMT)-like permease